MRLPVDLPADPVAACLLEVLGPRAAVREGWVASANRPTRAQGWKLHISATIVSAPDVMRRALPILLEKGASFKVARNLGCLSDLNEGLAGLSQVGKFITVYPDDDAQAVRLAVALDQATAGLTGPRIPSDRPLRPDSLVHYRYGGFTDLQLTDSLGQIQPAIRDPAGALVPDRRSPRFEPPEWAGDPFAAAGVVELAPEPDSTLFGGYLIVAALHQNAKGGVYLALDPRTAPPRTVVLKEGRRDLLCDPFGRDIRDRLRHQYRLLRELAPDPALPAAYDLFELHGNLYLAMEYVEGETLSAMVTEQQRTGGLISPAQVAELGTAVAAVVGRLHRRGLVVRDLTPTNVIVSPDRQVYLVDLELAHVTRDPAPPFSWGTRGYTSPQQARREPPAAADDIYALGATLFYLAAGSEPVFLPDDIQARRRALHLFHPAVPAALAGAIAACMDPEPAGRPADMKAVIAILSSPPPPDTASLPPRRTMASLREDCLALARGAGDHLLASAEQDAHGTFWASNATTQQPEAGANFLPRRRIQARYLHTGVAGTALFLAELGQTAGDRRYLEAAEDAARWLMATGAGPLPGLYFGEAGIAAVLCRLAQFTGKSAHVDTACGIAAGLIPGCTDMPDLTHGWAGMGLLHLMLAAATGAPGHLEQARALGDALAEKAEPAGAGVGWRQPPGPHPGFSGEMLTGFGHGAAGIGYFLLELWRATGESRYRRLADQAARWLIECGEPSLRDGSGMNWPLAHGNDDRWFFWCHGAAGIGLFFLRAWELTGDLEYRQVAAAAARTIAVAGRRGGPTLCHGVAGNGDMLLAAHRVLGDPAWLEAAADCAELVQLYALPRPDGVVWPAEFPGVITPDYMVGYAGVGAFLLRLAAPDLLRSPAVLPFS